MNKRTKIELFAFLLALLNFNNDKDVNKVESQR